VDKLNTEDAVDVDNPTMELDKLNTEDSVEVDNPTMELDKLNTEDSVEVDNPTMELDKLNTEDSVESERIAINPPVAESTIIFTLNDIPAMEEVKVVIGLFSMISIILIASIIHL
jgi:hypothetical protein